MTLSEAFSFGKYGPYVWSCYGLTTVALLWLLTVTRLQFRRELKRVRRRLEAAQSNEVSGSGDLH
jgi:heme exporter protein CcmD